MSNQDTSLQLVEQWRAGDEEAATQLYERYFQRLMPIVDRHLSQKYRGRLAPDDIVLSAIRTFLIRIRDGSFKFEEDLKVWKLLVTVALNKTRRADRREGSAGRDPARELRAPDNSSFDHFIAERIRKSPSVEEVLEFSELLESIMGCLSEQERKVLQLRLEGYQFQEIAEELGVNERTIRRIWQRVKERVAQLLELND